MKRGEITDEGKPIDGKRTTASTLGKSKCLRVQTSPDTSSRNGSSRKEKGGGRGRRTGGKSLQREKGRGVDLLKKKVEKRVNSVV